MTAFTTLVNALFLAGKPILGSTGSALRDNLLACLEGDPTAPKLKLAALDTLVTGATIKLRQDAMQTESSGTYLEVFRFGTMQSGQVNIYFEQRVNAAASVDGRIRRTRAGVTTTLVTHNTTSGTFVARNLDVGVIPGDAITVEHRRNTVGSAEIQNLRMRCDAAVKVFPVDNFGFWENM